MWRVALIAEWGKSCRRGRPRVDMPREAARQRMEDVVAGLAFEHRVPSTGKHEVRAFSLLTDPCHTVGAASDPSNKDAQRRAHATRYGEWVTGMKDVTISVSMDGPELLLLHLKPTAVLIPRPTPKRPNALV